MAELHETIMGRKLIEYTLPEIAEQLKRIADALEHGKIRWFMDTYPNNQELGEKVREFYTRFK